MYESLERKSKNILLQLGNKFLIIVLHHKVFLIKSIKTYFMELVRF